MSTRLIASVGVVLCAAMTSFSIYLGVVEHIYKPWTTRTVSRVMFDGRESLCVKVQKSHNTTTTNGAVTTKVTCKSLG